MRAKRKPSFTGKYDDNTSSIRPSSTFCTILQKNLQFLCSFPLFFAPCSALASHFPAAAWLFPVPPLLFPQKSCMLQAKETLLQEAYSMKIMAIDYGDAHTGVAISDRTLTLTGFSTVITAYRPEAVIEKLLPLISEHEVSELVLGHPLNMDGTRGPRAEKAEGFAELLREATSLPVTLWDERRTTVDAHNILLGNGKRAKERKKTVDAVAASLMLEGYLTFKKRQQ